MPSRFSEDVARLLRQAGWHEGRHLDTGAAVAYLEVFGFKVSPAAVAFLAEFHGLHFDLVNGPHDFDVRRATSWMEPEDVPFVNRLIDEPLCPVGYGGRMFMLLSPSQRVVFLHDEWIGLIQPMALAEGMRAFLCVRATVAKNWTELTPAQIPPGFRT